MSEAPGLSRRTVVRTGLGAAVAIPLLAACSSDGEATPSAGSPAAALPKVADIPVGTAVSATIDGKPVVISRPTDTTVAAFTAVCTHQHCTVAPAGAALKCPCHGSMFDALTGAVTQGPAAAPLAAVPVSIKDGTVVAG
jgi:Rieske Fe-S protein